MTGARGCEQLAHSYNSAVSESGMEPATKSSVEPIVPQWLLLNSTDICRCRLRVWRTQWRRKTFYCRRLVPNWSRYKPITAPLMIQCLVWRNCSLIKINRLNGLPLVFVWCCIAIWFDCFKALCFYKYISFIPEEEMGHIRRPSHLTSRTPVPRQQTIAELDNPHPCLNRNPNNDFPGEPG